VGEVGGVGGVGGDTLEMREGGGYKVRGVQRGGGGL
jgi:hypothetical protein